MDVKHGTGVGVLAEACTPPRRRLRPVNFSGADVATFLEFFSPSPFDVFFASGDRISKSVSFNATAVAGVAGVWPLGTTRFGAGEEKGAADEDVLDVEDKAAAFRRCVA